MEYHKYATSAQTAIKSDFIQPMPPIIDVDQNATKETLYQKFQLMKRRYYAMVQLQAATSSISGASLNPGISAQDMELEQVIDTAEEIMSSDYVSLYLINEQTQELYLALSNARDSEGFRISIDCGIVGFVARTGETVIEADATRHAHYDASLDRANSFQTKSILAMPVVNEQGKRLGLMQAINRRNEDGDITAFSDHDAFVFGCLCSLTANALTKLQFYLTVKRASKVESTLLSLTRQLAAEIDIAHVAELVASGLRRILRPETVNIFFVNPAKNRLYLLDVNHNNKPSTHDKSSPSGSKQDHLRFSASFSTDHGLVGTCAREKRTVCVDCANIHPAFDVMVDQFNTWGDPRGFGQSRTSKEVPKSNQDVTPTTIPCAITSCICVPVTEPGGSIVAVIQVCNKQHDVVVPRRRSASTDMDSPRARCVYTTDQIPKSPSMLRSSSVSSQHAMYPRERRSQSVKISSPRYQGQSISTAISFSSSDVQLVESIASSAGVCLHKAILFRSIERAQWKTSTLLEIIKITSAQRDTSNFVDTMIRAVYSAVRADRVTLYVVDQPRKTLQVVVSRDIMGKRIPLESGIAGYVARTGEIVNVREAYKSEHFDHTMDDTTGYRTRSVVCIPIRDLAGRIVAVLQALNKSDQPSTLREIDGKSTKSKSRVMRRILPLVRMTRRPRHHHTVCDVSPIHCSSKQSSISHQSSGHGGTPKGRRRAESVNETTSSPRVRLSSEESSNDTSNLIKKASIATSPLAGTSSMRSPPPKIRNRRRSISAGNIHDVVTLPPNIPKDHVGSHIQSINTTSTHSNDALSMSPDLVESMSSNRVRTGSYLSDYRMKPSEIITDPNQPTDTSDMVHNKSYRIPPMLRGGSAGSILGNARKGFPEGSQPEQKMLKWTSSNGSMSTPSSPLLRGNRRNSASHPNNLVALEPSIEPSQTETYTSLHPSINTNTRQHTFPVKSSVAAPRLATMAKLDRYSASSSLYESEEKMNSEKYKSTSSIGDPTSDILFDTVKALGLADPVTDAGINAFDQDDVDILRACCLELGQKLSGTSVEELIFGRAMTQEYKSHKRRNSLLSSSQFASESRSTGLHADTGKRSENSHEPISDTSSSDTESITRSNRSILAQTPSNPKTHDTIGRSNITVETSAQHDGTTSDVNSDIQTERLQSLFNAHSALASNTNTRRPTRRVHGRRRSREFARTLPASVNRINRRGSLCELPIRTEDSFSQTLGGHPINSFGQMDISSKFSTPGRAPKLGAIGRSASAIGSVMSSPVSSALTTQSLDYTFASDRSSFANNKADSTLKQQGTQQGTQDTKISNKDKPSVQQSNKGFVSNDAFNQDENEGLHTKKDITTFPKIDENQSDYDVNLNNETMETVNRIRSLTPPVSNTSKMYYDESKRTGSTIHVADVTYSTIQSAHTKNHSSSTISTNDINTTSDIDIKHSMNNSNVDNTGLVRHESEYSMAYRISNDTNSPDIALMESNISQIDLTRTSSEYSNCGQMFPSPPPHPRNDDTETTVQPVGTKQPVSSTLLSKDDHIAPNNNQTTHSATCATNKETETNTLTNNVRDPMSVETNMDESSGSYLVSPSICISNPPLITAPCTDNEPPLQYFLDRVLETSLLRLPRVKPLAKEQIQISLSIVQERCDVDEQSANYEQKSLMTDHSLGTHYDKNKLTAALDSTVQLWRQSSLVTFELLPSLQGGALESFEFHIFECPLSLSPAIFLLMLQRLGIFTNLPTLRSDKILNFVAAMQQLYRNPIEAPFHNFTHGFAVSQATYVLLLRTFGPHVLSSVEQLALMIGAIAHDVGHPAVTNTFLVNAQSDLALDYNDCSVLENFHAAAACRVLRLSHASIFSDLNVQNQKRARDVLVQSILATDMSKHLDLIKEIKEWESPLLPIDSASSGASSIQGDADGQPSYHGSILDDDDHTSSYQNEHCSRTEIENIAESPSDSEDDETIVHVVNGFDEDRLPREPDRLKLCQFLLHCADLSGQVTPWKFALQWAERITGEFARQSELEELAGLELTPHMQGLDAAQGKAQIQVGFCDYVVAPLWRAMGDLYPSLVPCVEQLEANSLRYKQLSHVLATCTEDDETTAFIVTHAHNETAPWYTDNYTLPDDRTSLCNIVSSDTNKSQGKDQSSASYVDADQ